jgi:DNA-directed RNA polymerase specialized sigma24 family protein
MTDQGSSQFNRTYLSQQRLSDVITGCQEERSAYRRARTPESPWCVEIFRRAFANDQDAWTFLRTTFEPYLLSWARAQTQIEPEDVVQEAFIAFSRFAPRREGLVAGHSLGPVIEYLHECTRTAVVRLARKQLRHARQISFDYSIDSPDDRDLADRAELRLDLMKRIREILETEQEWQIFHCRFVSDMKPEDIFTLYRASFDRKETLYALIRRIIERLRRDQILRELCDRLPTSLEKADRTAFLTISTRENGEDGDSMNDLCAVDEALLLDYITGVASPEIRIAIERSPACLEAAQHLADEILPLIHELYRVSCPDELTLVAYQDRRLAGAEQLLVRGHVAICPLCQDECRLIDALNAAPREPPLPLTRRIVEALFMPRTQQPQPLRGLALQYHTPQALIYLSVRFDAQSQTWTLRGQVRTHAGLPLADPLEEAIMHPLSPADMGEHQGQIEAEGWFSFRDLVAGDYQLHLMTAEEEFVIQRIAIGEDDA